jgi:HlyD family secretion protein
VSLHDTAGQDRLIDRVSLLRKYRTPAILLLVAVAAFLTLGLRFVKLHGAGESVSRERLTIATVERGSFVRDVAADGQVVAAVSPTLYANVAGTVTLRVHAGDAVTQGQEVASIDSPDLTAKLSQEEATLQGLKIDWQRAGLDAQHKLSQLHDAMEQARVDQKTAQRELDRSRKAYELGAYSELQALKAEDALEKADFSFSQAKMVFDSQPEQNRFDVDSKKSLLDRQQFIVDDLARQVAGLHVRSPVDGQVGQVQVADRASVPKDAPLVTVVDLSALEVEIKIAEGLARDLKPGMAADFQGARHWSGTLSGVSPEVVGGQVTARLRFAGVKPAGLRQSQRLAVRIFIDRREHVLMVDRGSFMDQEGGGFAYVVHDDVAVRQPVRLGDASVQKVEILDGLAEGERIVINGTDAFNNADRVILAH